MKNIIRQLWNCIDTTTFNAVAIVICAIGAFVGMVIGFAGFWYGWLILAFCLAAAIFFIRDLNCVHDMKETNKIESQQ